MAFYPPPTSAAGGGVSNDILAGIPFMFGGDANGSESLDVYPTGSTFDALAQGTRPIDIDSALVAAGTYIIEAVMKVDKVIYEARVALFNLSDAPDLAMNETVSSSQTGAIVQSTPIVFAAGVKRYGVKLRASNTAARATAWGIRLRRTA